MGMTFRFYTALTELDTLQTTAMNRLKKMPKTFVQGKFSHRLRSSLNLLGTSLEVLFRRTIGKPLVPEWSISFEIGTLFYRRQFNQAFAMKSIAESRAYFDSLYTVIDPLPDVEVIENQPGQPKGSWVLPIKPASSITMLYFHGGGYSFNAAVTQHFVSMLAQVLNVKTFSLDYRLTPEHPHPAQIEDAVAAYRYLLNRGIDHKAIVVAGDSAGGHLALMTLIALKSSGLPQPALAIALSPWTDTGKRGKSLFGNDRFDMVQGYQTQQYSEWLKGGNIFTDEELSPMHQDYRATAPIYIQAGSHEILVDMIRDFAKKLTKDQLPVRLDVWQNMTHEFHAYGHTIPESKQALERIRQAIDWATRASGDATFVPIAQTEVDSLQSPNTTQKP